MSIMRANLKHLYQRKAALLFFLFFALIFAVIIASFLDEDGSGAILGVFALVFFIGLFAAAAQVEILSKPFSYCLPGHNAVPIKFLIWTCILISLVPPAAFLFRGEFELILLRLLTIFSLSTTAYWLGVWTVFRLRNWSAFMGLFAFAPLIAIWTEGNTSIESFIFGSWFVIVLLGIGVNYFAYKFLSTTNLSRRYCGKMWMGALDAWNKEKITKFQQIKLQEKEDKKKGREFLLPKVEEFFLAKISDRTMSDTAKHIWSGLYRSLAVLLSTKQWSLLIMMPLLVCFMCYMGPGGAFIYIFPAFMVIHMSLHIQSPLLISGGRRERFYTALVLAITVNVLIVLLLLLASPISVLIEPIMPKIMSSTFQPLDAKLSFIPLLAIPLAFAGTHLFPKQTMLSKMVPLIGIMMFFQFFIFMDITKKTLPVTFSIIAGSIVLSWAVLVLLLGHICSRRCLGQ